MISEAELIGMIVPEFRKALRRVREGVAIADGVMRAAITLQDRKAVAVMLRAIADKIEAGG